MWKKCKDGYLISKQFPKETTPFTNKKNKRKTRKKKAIR
jgi:hypothetical protein